MCVPRDYDFRCSRQTFETLPFSYPLEMIIPLLSLFRVQILRSGKSFMISNSVSPKILKRIVPWYLNRADAIKRQCRLTCCWLRIKKSTSSKLNFPLGEKCLSIME